MTLMDYPIDARFRAIEDRLTAIERDIAVIKQALKSVPTGWFMLTLILPLYAILVIGFAGVFYFLFSAILPTLARTGT